MDYLLIFITGLTSGGVACAAMQGGLLASVIANGKSKELESSSPSLAPRSFDLGDWGPVSAFLVAKLFSHLLLGALLGWAGSTFAMSLNFRLFFQGFSALFMLATAGNLLELHPAFRYLSFTPPKFARHLIKYNQSHASLFAPIILGLLTVFVPCGVTQAMAVSAINSGSPLSGLLIMGSFVLGTIPIFLLIGLATAKFSELWRTYFLRIAAIILIGMGLYSLNGILVVLDSPLALQPSRSNVANTTQQVTIDVKNNGYSPNYFKVNVGQPVELTLRIGSVYTCAASFTFTAFNIHTFLEPNTAQVFNFTPLQKGKYTFSCSMGMYSGVMEVI